MRERRQVKSDMNSSILSIRTVCKTRTGGRRRRFSVLLGVGDEKGSVGLGTGTADSIGEAIKKAEREARRRFIKIPMKGETVSHDVEAESCGTKVILHQGKSGLLAGGVARTILELAGVKNCKCKCIGNSMSRNNVGAALFECFKKLTTPKEIAERLGKTVPEVLQRKFPFLEIEKRIEEEKE